MTSTRDITAVSIEGRFVLKPLWLSATAEDVRTRIASTAATTTSGTRLCHVMSPLPWRGRRDPNHSDRFVLARGR